MLGSECAVALDLAALFLDAEPKSSCDRLEVVAAEDGPPVVSLKLSATDVPAIPSESHPLDEAVLNLKYRQLLVAPEGILKASIAVRALGQIAALTPLPIVKAEGSMLSTPTGWIKYLTLKCHYTQTQDGTKLETMLQQLESSSGSQGMPVIRCSHDGEESDYPRQFNILLELIHPNELNLSLN